MYEIMNLETFRPLFSEEWFEAFKPFLESKEFSKLWKEIAEEAKRDAVYPYSASLKKLMNNDKLENCIFKAFKVTPYDKLKVIILGLSPYFNKTKINSSVSVPEADGLAFSCKTKEQPSLKVIYDGLQSLSDKQLVREHNLEFMAEQGILLLNSALTTRFNMPTIHLELWKPFIEYFFTKIITKKDNLHILFLGKEAQVYKKLVQQRDHYTLAFPNTHWVYEQPHPAFFARKQQSFPPHNLKIISRDTGVFFDKALEELCPF